MEIIKKYIFPFFLGMVLIFLLSNILKKEINWVTALTFCIGIPFFKFFFEKKR